MENENIKSNILFVLSQLGNLCSINNEEEHQLIKLMRDATDNVYNDDPEVQNCMQQILDAMKNGGRTIDQDKQEEIFSNNNPVVIFNSIDNLRQMVETIRKTIDIIDNYFS